jgi:hypothetical protein
MRIVVWLCELEDLHNPNSDPPLILRLHDANLQTNKISVAMKKVVLSDCPFKSPLTANDGKGARVTRAFSAITQPVEVCCPCRL